MSSHDITFCSNPSGRPECTSCRRREAPSGIQVYMAEFGSMPVDGEFCDYLLEDRDATG